MSGISHTFASSINDRRAGTFPGNTQIKKVMKTYFELNAKFEGIRRELVTKKIILVPLSDVADFVYYCDVLCGIYVNGGSLNSEHGAKSQYLYIH